MLEHEQPAHLHGQPKLLETLAFAGASRVLASFDDSARDRHVSGALAQSPRALRSSCIARAENLRLACPRGPSTLAPQGFARSVTACPSATTTRQRDRPPAFSNQALAALLFLYSDVLGQRLEWLHELVRAKRP